MTTSNLKIELANAVQVLRQHEADVQAKRQQLVSQESNQAQLSFNLTNATRTLGSVFDVKDVDAAKQAVEKAQKEKDGSDMVIKNLKTFLQTTAPAKERKLREDVNVIKTKLWIAVREETLSAISQMPEEQLKLLKDFVVLNKALLGHGFKQHGFGLGAAVTEIYGELKGADFDQHRSQLTTELEQTISV